MEADRYKKIDELFDLVLELDTFEREGYLDKACGGDVELRREVETLLEAYEKADNFIETPAIEVAAESLAGEGRAALIGTKIAHYEIMSLLGAGGMGEVYLTNDSRLGRKVALKLLPPQFTRDSDRVARFQRESRAASALNHPNIITIYERSGHLAALA